MPRIIKKISDGSIIPDFQSKSSKGLLIANAVKLGMGTEKDFEEIEVDDETFLSYVDSYKAGFRASKLTEERRMVDMKASIEAKFKELGITSEELKYFKYVFMDD